MQRQRVKENGKSKRQSVMAKAKHKGKWQSQKVSSVGQKGRREMQKVK